MKFWDILKYFGIGAGSLGILYGVFTFFDNMQDDIVSVKDDISEVQETVDYINIEQGWIAEDIGNIKDTLISFEEQHKSQGQNIKSIAWGLRNHQNFTPEQFEDIMEELLKKNSSYNPSPPTWIPLSWERYPVNENEPGSMK